MDSGALLAGLKHEIPHEWDEELLTFRCEEKKNCATHANRKTPSKTRTSHNKEMNYINE